MANYTFEIGFDLSAAPVAGGGILRYPLQWSLVDEAARQLVSPANLDLIKTDDTLAFRVYDITQSQPTVPAWEPVSLQVLFNNATDRLETVPFSPIDASQLITLSFTAGAPASVAFGVDGGWNVGGTETQPKIVNSGRFELRMLLTVTSAGEMARYYYVDPEMVVGVGGTGN